MIDAEYVVEERVENYNGPPEGSEEASASTSAKQAEDIAAMNAVLNAGGEVVVEVEEGERVVLLQPGAQQAGVRIEMPGIGALDVGTEIVVEGVDERDGELEVESEEEGRDEGGVVSEEEEDTVD